MEDDAMKNDDYFVVAYKILAYLYECVKLGEKPDKDAISAEALEINERYWSFVMKSLFDEGRITGGKHSSQPYEFFVGIRNPQITEKGIVFLMENSSIEKAKKFLMDLKKMIPGI